MPSTRHVEPPFPCYAVCLDCRQDVAFRQQFLALRLFTRFCNRTRMNDRPARNASPFPGRGPGPSGGKAPETSGGDAGSLAIRLKAVIGDGSVAAFSRKCGLAESVLRTYLKDGRIPPLDKALAIATAAGVSVDWLAGGRALRVAEARAVYAPLPVRGQLETGSTSLPLDAVVLEGILKAVLEGRGADATPEQLAALVVDLYRRATTPG